MLTNQLSQINYQSPCDWVKSTKSPQGFNIKYPFMDQKKHAIHIKSPFSDVSMIFPWSFPCFLVNNPQFLWTFCQKVLKQSTGPSATSTCEVMSVLAVKLIRNLWRDVQWLGCYNINEKYV